MYKEAIPEESASILEMLSYVQEAVAFVQPIKDIAEFIAALRASSQANLSTRSHVHLLRQPAVVQRAHGDRTPEGHIFT